VVEAVGAGENATPQVINWTSRIGALIAEQGWVLLSGVFHAAQVAHCLASRNGTTAARPKPPYLSRLAVKTDCRCRVAFDAIRVDCGRNILNHKMPTPL
jgi:uncharacterized membrane protein